MINHTRTLLLNKSALRSHTENVGELYIDPKFKEIILSPELNRFKQLIVPDGCSRFQNNYLVYCYMCILNTPELLPYTMNFDSRITYDINDKIYSNKFVGGLNTKEFRSNTNVELFIKFIESDAVAGDYLEWTIEKRTSDTFRIVTPKKVELIWDFKKDTKRIDNKIMEAPTVNSDINIGTTPFFDLIPGILSVRFKFTDVYKLTGDYRCFISVGIPKLFSLDNTINRIDELLRIDNKVYNTLFSGKLQEVILFRQLFNTADNFVIKLGSSLLAYIYALQGLL